MSRTRRATVGGPAASLALSALIATVLLPTGARGAGPATVENELAAPSGTADARATAVNDAGVIAGWALWESFPNPPGESWPHALYWKAPAGGGQPVPHELPDLDGHVGGRAAWTEALAINNENQIVGWSNTTGDILHHAVVWTPTAGGAYGAPFDLGKGLTSSGLLDQPKSEALAINDAGQIVGWADTPADPRFTTHGTRAVLWTRESASSYSMTTLGPDTQANAVLGETAYPTSRATGINDAGEIIGEIGEGLATIGGIATIVPAENIGGPIAVAWLPSPAPAITPPTGLPDPPDHVTHVLLRLSTQPSHAVGINNLGQVIGSSGDQAVIWSRSDPNLPYTDTALPQLGVGNQALAINIHGQVAGLITYPGFPVSGHNLPVIWTPSGPGGPYAAPVLAGVDQDGPFGEARGINISGEVIGDVHPRDSNPDDDDAELGYQATLWLPPKDTVPPPPPTDHGPPPPDGVTPPDAGASGEDLGAFSMSHRGPRQRPRTPPLTEAPATLSGPAQASGTTGSPAPTTAPTVGINLVAGGHAGGRSTRPQEPGSESPLALAADAFLATITALVLVPAGLIVLGWLAWQRGWAAGVWRRLSHLRARRQAGDSPW